MVRINPGKDSNKETNGQTKTQSGNKELLNAINGLNNTLNNNFKVLNATLNDISKPKRNRRNNEELSMDRLKLEREKNLNDHQDRMEKLKEEKLLESLRQQRKKYKDESIWTLPYRTVNNVRKQKSSDFSSAALGLMTGGIINPVIAKSFGLDKLLTAGAKYVGRTTITALDLTFGQVFRNAFKPLTSRSKRLKNDMKTGANNFTKSFTSGFGLFGNNSENVQEGAVGKNKDKFSKIADSVEQIKDHIKKPKTEKEKKDKKEKKTLLDRIFEGIGSLGVILQGAATVAIPIAISKALPRVTGWLDEKFKGFLTSSTGLSESGAENVSQLIKDILPGAIFGFTVSGWKGAAIGSILSAGYNIILKTLNNWKNIFTGKEEEQENSLSDYFESAVTGAVIAGMSKKGKSNPKRIIVGAMIGAAIPLITEKVSAWKKMFSSEENGGDINAIGWGEAAFQGAITGGIVGFKTGGLKGLVIGAILGAVGGLALKGLAKAKKYITEWLGESEEEKIQREKLEKATTTRLDYEENEKKALESLGEKEYFKSRGIKTEEDMNLSQLRVYQTYKSKNIKPETTGQGYGTINPMSTGNSVWHGIPATSLKNMGLKGEISSINTEPYVATQNEQCLKSLDQILNDWGYDIIYTSAMGGHKVGTGHWRGNKVDLQLKKNGQPAHLTPQQLETLRISGYFGSGTGALGWEPIAGQVGGGHYDLFIGNGNSGTALASNASSLKLETNDMLNSSESQDFAMTMMNETASNSAESINSSNATILDLLGSMNNTVANSYTENNTNPSISQGFGESGFSVSQFNVSAASSSAGGNNGAKNVYAYGDVAKTPILYTL